VEALPLSGEAVEEVKNPSVASVEPVSVFHGFLFVGEYRIPLPLRYRVVGG
jgi:hypothetical protein